MELKNLISEAIAQYDINSENKEFKVILNVPYQTTISIFSSIVGCFEHEEACFSSNLDKSFLFVPEKYYDFNLDITPLSDNSGTQLVFQYDGNLEVHLAIVSYIEKLYVELIMSGQHYIVSKDSVELYTPKPLIDEVIFPFEIQARGFLIESALSDSSLFQLIDGSNSICGKGKSGKTTYIQYLYYRCIGLGYKTILLKDINCLNSLQSVVNILESRQERLYVFLDVNESFVSITDFVDSVAKLGKMAVFFVTETKPTIYNVKSLQEVVEMPPISEMFIQTLLNKLITDDYPISILSTLKEYCTTYESLNKGFIILKRHMDLNKDLVQAVGTLEEYFKANK